MNIIYILVFVSNPASLHFLSVLFFSVCVRVCACTQTHKLQSPPSSPLDPFIPTSTPHPPLAPAWTHEPRSRARDFRGFACFTNLLLLLWGFKALKYYI